MKNFVDKCFRFSLSRDDSRISHLAPQYECPHLSLLIITSDSEDQQNRTEALFDYCVQHYLGVIPALSTNFFQSKRIDRLALGQEHHRITRWSVQLSTNHWRDISSVESLTKSTSIVVEKLQNSCPKLRVFRAANITLTLSSTILSNGFTNLEELSIPFNAHSDNAIEQFTKSADKLKYWTFAELVIQPLKLCLKSWPGIYSTRLLVIARNYIHNSSKWL